MPDPVSTLNLIPAARVRLWEDAFKVFHLKVDDQEFVDVRPARVFPVTGRAGYVAFISEQGKEVALVSHPEKLDAASRAALDAALARTYYVPEILRIDEIAETWGISRWRVLTDRGYAVFEVVDREHIRKFPDGRFIIQDADGNRFEIPDISFLDVRSQTLIQSET